jgi:hypothetical protein
MWTKLTPQSLTSSGKKRLSSSQNCDIWNQVVSLQGEEAIRLAMELHQKIEVKAEPIRCFLVRCLKRPILQISSHKSYSQQICSLIWICCMCKCQQQTWSVILEKKNSLFRWCYWGVGEECHPIVVTRTRTIGSYEVLIWANGSIPLLSKWLTCFSSTSVYQ